MKNIYDFFKIILLSAFIVVPAACSKDKQEPEFPDPAILAKVSENPQAFMAEWSKLEVRFSKGHSHGYFHGSPEYPVKHLKTVQRFYFENKNGKIEPASGNPTAIRWEGVNVIEKPHTEGDEEHHDDEEDDFHSHQSNAGVVLYAVELIFYDKNGKRVNALLSEGNSPEHYQFFFTANNFTAVASNTTVPTQQEALEYKYRDTNPEELYIKGGAKFDKKPNAPKGVLRKEQIGLKGFFTLKRTYINFDMHIALGYFAQKPADLSYDKAPERKVLELRIPIHVYTDILDEAKSVEDAVREFGVSKEEIEKDQNDIIASDLDPESSQIYI